MNRLDNVKKALEEAQSMLTDKADYYTETDKNFTILFSKNSGYQKLVTDALRSWRF